MSSKKKWLIFFVNILFTAVYSQNSDTIALGFYNVENLFNPHDDSLKNDDSFTPQGFNHWTYKKYVRKVNNIAKVLLAINGWEPPDLMGLAEIEDATVLKKLCHDSPLKKYRYDYVHYESPDPRGIDVALLYRRGRVKILHSEPIPIVFPFEPGSRNRDILYAVAQLSSGDTLHLFVNHWTSRYGGYAPTIPKRNHYASVVRQKCDSILQACPAAAIVITGDFNDYPTDESICDVLQAGDPDNPLHTGHTLFNLMCRFERMQNIGSHKHEDFWGCLDQIIVSSPLLDETNPLHIENGQAHIFKADFMVEPDEKYDGYKVFRTYSGPRYMGGYSDHLPVFIQCISQHKISPIIKKEN
ncbi:MAG: endonuclease [Bacteroidales bacterium]|nr:endonuclease [Bacteroidales bacterium]